MKCFLPDFPSEKALELMVVFGYVRHFEDGFVSHVRSPYAPEARFPRFHASCCSKDEGFQINLHLDQENVRGQGNHQFVWAYRNPLVISEIERLKKLFNHAKEQIV